MEDNREKTINEAIIRTFRFLHENVSLCPKCRNYMIIDGYRCFGCGYDITSSNNNEH